MPMVKVHCGCFDINIMGIFGWLFWMLKWMIIFVLLQVCLGNAGVSFIKPKWINVGEVLSVLLGSEHCIFPQRLLGISYFP